MDLTVGQDQEDVVDLIVKALCHILDYLLQDRSEVGRTIEADVGKLLAVLLKNVFDALDLRVADVTVQREAVVDILVAHVVRDASEAVDRERLIAVVAFQDGADVPDSVLILIVAT